MRPTWRGRPLRACLFDLDGTLIAPSIDFGLMHRRVLETVSRCGLSAEIFVGMHVLEIIERAHAMLAPLDVALAETVAAEAHAAVDAIEMAAAERVQSFAGARELLDWLVAGDTKVGIVTRNARRPVLRILERMPLTHDVLLTRDDVSHVKPDPRHLQQALVALDCATEDSLMVGDHPMDVRAGRDAGMATVALLSSGSPRAAFAPHGPDLILNGVAELRGVLGRE